MSKTPNPPADEPPAAAPAKPKPASPVQFGPTVSTPGSRLKKR